MLRGALFYPLLGRFELVPWSDASVREITVWPSTRGRSEAVRLPLCCLCCFGSPLRLRWGEHWSGPVPHASACLFYNISPLACMQLRSVSPCVLVFYAPSALLSCRVSLALSHSNFCRSCQRDGGFFAFCNASHAVISQQFCFIGVALL